MKGGKEEGGRRKGGKDEERRKGGGKEEISTMSSISPYEPYEERRKGGKEEERRKSAPPIKRSVF